MLIANMVGRNEAGRYLEQCLNHLNGFADKIIFTDDCSDDNTPDIAEKYGCEVQVMDEPTFIENEGLLRNSAWQFLEEFASPGDWVLAIDADELLYGVENLPSLMNQSIYDVLGITFYHMWNPLMYRVDKAWQPNLSSRLFRYYQGGSFLQRKLACGSEPTYVQQLIRQNRALWHTGLNMQHLGYMRDEDKMDKYRRYMELDGGDFHSRTHIESIIDPTPILVEWKFNENL